MGVRQFKTRVESLVESNMIYGAKIWGCSKHLEPMEQVQLRALRMFFGVGTLHPTDLLLREGREEKMHCVKISSMWSARFGV